MQFRKLLWFGAGYFTLALVLLWPLVRDLRTGIPHDVGDPLLNTWILWWNAHAVPFTARWWNGPVYWPLPDFLALSEHLVGLSVLSTPMQWLGAGPQLAYNTVLFLSWPLSAIAAHALCWRLTGRHDAGLVGGLVFGFNPYRLGQTPHIQVMASWWMPVALFALHRAVDIGTVRRAMPWLAFFAAAWLLQAFSNGYFLFYFSVLVGLWIAWFAARPRTWQMALAIVVAWIAAGACTVPVLLHYKAVHEYWNLERGLGEVIKYSADLTSFATGSVLLRWWPFRPESRPEQALYPGVVAAAIVFAGMTAAALSADAESRRRRAVLALLGAAAIFLVAALATLVTGEWEIEIGPVDVSGRRARKPLFISFALVLLAGVLDRRVRRAVRSRSQFLFYGLATFVCFAMCLGPTGRIMGEQILHYPPYWWLLQLPGVENLRVPTRFIMVALVPFAVAAALAFARLTHRLSDRSRLIAISLCALAILADSWARPLPMLGSPERYTLPEEARDAAVVELPLGDTRDADTSAMIRATSHGRPVANGYTGYFPDPYLMLGGALRERDRSALLALASFDRLCIVIDRRMLLARNSRVMTESTGARLAAVDRDYSFYILERQQMPSARRTTAVAIRQVVPLGWSSPAPQASDGRIETYWESSTWQRGNEALTIELVEEAPVAGVALAMGRRISGYPRRLNVDVSIDGATWTTVWEGPTAGRTYIAAVTDIRRTRFTVGWEPRRARFVRLRQTGSAMNVYWSVAEVEVLR